MDSSTIFDQLTDKIGQLRYPRSDGDRAFITKVLDGLNCLNYRYPIVRNTTKAVLLINQCCTIITPDDSLAVKKCCQLFKSLIKSQEVKVEGRTLIISIQWCLQALKTNSGAISIDIVNVIEALLRDNVHNVTVFLDAIIDVCDKNIKLIGDVPYQEELCLASLHCLQACTDVSSEQMSSNFDKLKSCFKKCGTIFISFLTVNKPLKTTVAYNKMLEMCLMGLQKIVSLDPDNLHKELGIILGIVKTYMLYNVKNIDFLSVNTLSPSMLGLPELPASYPRAKNGGKLTKQRKPIPSSSNNKRQKEKQKQNNDLTDMRTTGYVPASQYFDYNSDGLGSSLLNQRLKTSDSEFSDSESGSLVNFNRSSGKVRQAALNLLYYIIKYTEKPTMFSYWTSFVPDTPSLGKHNLVTCVLKDPSVRGKMCALNTLLLFLTSSKLYLIQAESSEKSSSFTPFSVVLGLSLVELHRSLSLALRQDAMPVLALVLKCLAALIQATPYHRMNTGLITKIIRNVKALIYYKDVSIQVTSLIVMGCILAYEPVIPEVQQAMIKSDRETSNVTTKPDEVSTNDGEDFDYDEFSSDEEESENESGEIPWLLQRCLRNLGVLVDDTGNQENTRVVQPPVKIESLQIISAMSITYFESLMLPHLSLITKALEACFFQNVADVKMHAGRAAEFLGQAIGRVAENDCSRSCINFWQTLLGGGLVSLIQDAQNPALRPIGCDCLGTIGPFLFQLLPRDKQILCITLLFGCAKDEDSAVRGAAVRSLAICVLYPSLREDPGFVYDTAQCILTSLKDENLIVKTKASWSLSSLSDALVLNGKSADMLEEKLHDDVLFDLFKGSVTACGEYYKIKTNLARGLGNFLQMMDDTLLQQERFRTVSQQAINVLVEASTTGGNMKMRWNACYALGNGLKNPNLFEKLDKNTWQQNVFTSLSDLVVKYKNFKVRINATLALTSPVSRIHYGNFYYSIWETLLTALENSQYMENYTEYNHRDQLVEQICLSLGHLTTLLTKKDLPLLENTVSLYYDTFKMHMHKVLERMVPEKSTDLSSAAFFLDSLEASCTGSSEKSVISALKSVFYHSII